MDDNCEQICQSIDQLTAAVMLLTKVISGIGSNPRSIRNVRDEVRILYDTFDGNITSPSTFDIPEKRLT